MEKLLTFKRFHTAGQAAEIITLLKAHQIPVDYEEEMVLDKVYTGQNFDQRHLVKIPADYFSQADKLLKSEMKVSLDDVEPDYYLLSFSTEELKEIIHKKDEWGDYDYVLALQLLEKQGITYSAEQLDTLGNDRIETLSTPQDLPKLWQAVGFLSPLLLLLAFIPFIHYFAFLGIFIGAFVRLTKKTLPDGSRIHAFSEKTREQGKWMLLTGPVLIVICLTILLKVIF
ncbi:hypothetical protein CLV59_107342 [Chitinophaga dinghuensis]|uniref:Uncharacterized protein n=1 Tax=Chitinophaga dinghuensis TaxID=1539050 RepID=A0A327VQJ9_9BACT|nr:hypothetical protein [Chitinophaga dinghuensis]RAJ77575.1 hypothetical protein CLV59_107342 [Chitinophaga dinghuensis]